MNLTPGQSHYVLQTLVASGKIRVNQVKAALKGRQKEIVDLRQRLAALEGLGGSSRAAAAPARRTRARKTVRRRARLSPKVRALRRLQGRYMGYVRRLKAAEKARVRAVREKQGMEAAIRLASSLAPKS
jgi:hypothetical protein